MTKHEYLEKLANKLRALPMHEVSAAIEYYDSYLSDADDEAAAIAQLGPPGEVAATILSDYAAHKPKGSPQGHSRIRTLYIALLAIFALPIGLPLIVAAIGLIIGLIAVVISVIAAGVAILLGGIAGLVYTPFALANDTWFGVMTAGIAVAAIGAGILVFKGGIKLIGCFPAISGALVRRMRRDKSPGHTSPYPLDFTQNNQYAFSQPEHRLPAPDTAYDPLQTTNQQYPNTIIPLQPHETFKARRRIFSTRAAALLILLGAILCSRAWLADVRADSLLRNNRRIRFTAPNRHSNTEVTNTPLEEIPLALEEVPLSLEEAPFHMVNINTSFNNIVIRSSDTAKLYMPTNIEARIDDGVLSITQGGRGTFSDANINLTITNRNEIRLYLPPEFYVGGNGIIQAESISGRIIIEGGYLQSISATTTSGRIEIRDIENEIHNVTIISSSGNIIVENMQHAYFMRAFSSSGSINMDNISWSLLYAVSHSGRININHGPDLDGHLDTTQITASSGSVNLELNKPREYFALNLRTSTGTARVDGNRVDTVTETNTAGNIIDILSSSGSISVNFVG